MRFHASSADDKVFPLRPFWEGCKVMYKKVCLEFYPLGIVSDMKSPTLTSFAYALVFLGQAFGVSSGFLAQAGDLNFGLPNFEAPRDVPSLNLSSLPSADFTILSHPMFPQHSVRIKRSHFCDPTVKWVKSLPQFNTQLTSIFSVFTGYLDFQARHLFFVSC